MTWEKRRQLPKGWDKLRAQVRAEAGDRCEWTTNGVRCVRQGRECDHINGRENHARENLQWLCVEHHREKTRAEAKAALIRTRREPEQHPGLAR